jgi:spore maturation protein CgeB
MKLVVFGLSISSSWGNGHATLWRGLCKSLAKRAHQVVFFERDVPYYAGARDYYEIPNGRLHLYDTWESIRETAANELSGTDAAIVTSYCGDGIPATQLVLDSHVQLRVFYDLDTPVTLHQISNGHPVPYISTEGLRGFDLVLSYTGGEALLELQRVLGAQRVAPLYGSVDPEVHFRVNPAARYSSDLSYMGTYAEDRQEALDALFVKPARRMTDRRFLIGGAMYPDSFPWAGNIYFVRHLAPCEHPEFFSSSRLTLNVTRKAMASMGFCPSGRLFEAAACSAPIITDNWAGIEEFYKPGTEIIIAESSEEVEAAIGLSDEELTRIAKAAYERTMNDHTSDQRAEQLVRLIESVPQELAEAS